MPVAFHTASGRCQAPAAPCLEDVSHRHHIQLKACLWLPQEAVGTIAEERSECAALRGRLASLEAHAAESAEERGAEVTRLLDQVWLHRPSLVLTSSKVHAATHAPWSFAGATMLLHCAASRPAHVSPSSL